MKSTDIEKSKALKLMGKMKQATQGGRFPADANNPGVDRRQQRKLDQARGLVAFPAKLRQALIEEIRQRAAAQNISTNEVLDALLEQALRSPGTQATPA